jgi:hypothetical protein
MWINTVHKQLEWCNGRCHELLQMRTEFDAAVSMKMEIDVSLYPTYDHFLLFFFSVKLIIKAVIVCYLS